MAQTVQNIKKWAGTHRDELLWLAFVLLTLPHFNAMNGYSPQMETLINGMRMVSALVTGVWLVLIRRRLSPIVLAVGAWQGYLLLNTLLQHSGFANFKYGFTAAAAPIISAVMLYDLMQSDRKIFLSSQMFCFELMIYTNLATVLLFPGGMYTRNDNIFGRAIKGYYFLGYDTNIYNYFIPALLILSLWEAPTKWQKWRKVLLVIGIYFTAFRVWAGTTIVVLCIMGAACLLLKKLPPFLNYFSVWAIPVCFFLCVQCLRLQNLFRWFIEGVLGKWSSFMGRMAIWDITMEKISQAPLFGYGFVDRFVRQKELNVYYGNHAHNLLLELLYQGGIVNLLFFAGVVFLVGWRVYRHRKTTESKLITVAFLGWCMVSLVDTFAGFPYVMFVIAYYSNRDALQPGEKDPLDIPKWDEWLRAAPDRLRARFAHR